MRAQRAEEKEEERQKDGFWSRRIFPRLCGAYDGFQDAFISVEVTNLWRLHQIHSIQDGKELVAAVVSRFTNLTVMLTLLIGTQVATLFSPSHPADSARAALEDRDVGTVQFWAGLLLCLGILLSTLSLLAVLTGRALFSAVAPQSAHAVFGSSACLYAATLPVRMSLASIYLFLLWMILFLYVICSWETATALTVLCVVLLLHLVTLYSAVGRVVLHCGALHREDPDPIVPESDGENSSPKDLTETIVRKAVTGRRGKIPVQHQYRIRYQRYLNLLEEGDERASQLDELRLSKYQDEKTQEDNAGP